jgi:uncharacterized ion transporter superfamily protein YfcC
MFKKLKLPTPITLMMLVIILAAVSTWLLPAGQYSKLSADGDSGFLITSKSGSTALPFTQQILDSLSIKIKLEKFKNGDITKPVSVPHTYQREKQKPQGFIAILQAPVKGIIDSIDIVLFIMFIGGFMQVFHSTGALMNGVKYLAQRMKGRERLLIIILICIFSFLGGSYGMDVESIVFYPVLVPLFIAAGYDLMVPLAIVFGGACIGYISSFTNPFSTIIASNAAGISWMDGLNGRLLYFVISTAILILYTLRYAAKVKKDASASIVYKVDGVVNSPFAETIENPDEKIKLGGKTKLLLLIFCLTFISMIGGIVFFNWWTIEMSAMFLSAALLVGIINRMNEKLFVSDFIKGMQGLLSVALIVGLARGVTIILNEGFVSDSILFYASSIVQHFSPVFFILLLLLFYFLFTFLISSSSGMAVLTMPIIAGLAIIVNVPGREVVNAYLFGMGVMFLITPTGSVFPALTMIQVSYKAWLKFIMPLIMILLLLSSVFLIVGIYL